MSPPLPPESYSSTDDPTREARGICVGILASLLGIAMGVVVFLILSWLMG